MLNAIGSQTNPTHVELVESVQLLRRLRSEAAGGELLNLQCTPSLPWPLPYTSPSRLRLTLE